MKHLRRLLVGISLITEACLIILAVALIAKGIIFLINSGYGEYILVPTAILGFSYLVGLLVRGENW